ncbi:AraC family transcriptional regulator [Alicyclobacillus fastidiosus]|uniref:AraC family transcriptional regulator n=1 Tax=Alicyclobacillus fastidiosus TaxID=392011 RepID=A0ABY6ZCQ8_9BACL|nr:AraC family transcriptional regulator [Alicyclobacillus fastidiosus]WAH40041.1 AraC family transcriptional regulator [Alicyclobacillus fastidiosus]GMA61345.1 transcriptional regulator [Alicyclobacillus fastidiosus]
MGPYGRHFVTTELDQRLPLHLSTVGYSEHQIAINREDGFHCFHWLHTVEGCGKFTVNGTTVKLSTNQGILLKPGVPHSYSPETQTWSTWYLTFDGALANPITASLDLQHMLPISWDADAPLATIHEHFGEKCRYSFDFAGINGSLEVYAFLGQLKQFGQVRGQPSLSKGHERLTPIYLLIEEQYGDPHLGLERMAAALQISSQHLNTLFRKSWGVSPYQYLLQFRIQKSKELLVSGPNRAVKTIAEAVGFKDYSHFVHTFHKLTGMTPVQFRQQYS